MVPRSIPTQGPCTLSVVGFPILTLVAIASLGELGFTLVVVASLEELGIGNVIVLFYFLSYESGKAGPGRRTPNQTFLTRAFREIPDYFHRFSREIIM